MSLANPLWGAPRVHGELLGFNLRHWQRDRLTSGAGRGLGTFRGLGRLGKVPH